MNKAVVPLAALLRHLEKLTFDIDSDTGPVSAISIYSEPSSGDDDSYHSVVAAESGFEGIACVDDTARAAVLALDVYDTTGDEHALALATGWLSFIAYMQYPDGNFANFIRNATGTRNASSPTSVRGGYWWSGRALWALGRAYRVTGLAEYQRRFYACDLDPITDGKISALLALGEIEMYLAEPDPALRDAIISKCERIIDVSAGSDYFLDQASNPLIHLWGYHQVEALARTGALFDRVDLIHECKRTVRALIEPAVNARFWHSFPARSKQGVCAYDVSPAVRGLVAMYRATGETRYRTLALRGCAWLYGRNDAHTPMYDPATGRCRDGIMNGEASENFGAESSIEAGGIELARRGLVAG